MTYAPVVAANRRIWPFRLPPRWTLLTSLLAALALGDCSSAVLESDSPDEGPKSAGWLIAPWCRTTSCSNMTLRIPSGVMDSKCDANIKPGDALCIQLSLPGSPSSLSNPFLKLHVKRVFGSSVELDLLPYPMVSISGVHAFLLKEGDITDPSADFCPTSAWPGRASWSWDEGDFSANPLVEYAGGGSLELHLDPIGKVRMNVKADALTPHSIVTNPPSVRTTDAMGNDQLTFDWNICDTSTIELAAQSSRSEHVVWHEGLDCETGNILGTAETQTLSLWDSPLGANPPGVAACAYYYTGCEESPVQDSCSPATCASEGHSVQVTCVQERCVLDRANYKAAPGIKQVDLHPSPIVINLSETDAPSKPDSCLKVMSVPGGIPPHTQGCQSAQINPPDLLVPPGFGYVVQVEGQRIKTSTQMMPHGGCSYVPGSRSASTDDDPVGSFWVQLARGDSKEFMGKTFSVNGIVQSAPNECSALQFSVFAQGLGTDEQLIMDKVTILGVVAN